MKKTFKDILKELPTLKRLKIGSQEHLPHIFDLLYDIKYPSDLITYQYYHADSELWRYISENHYNTQEIRKFIKEHKEEIAEAIDWHKFDETFKGIEI